MRKLCGIDEAGRGPITGDLVMAGIILINRVEGLMDSKVLTEKKRDEQYEQIITELEAQTYLFDGNQTFGVLGVNTMVKADGKIPEVSAASILAKVTHDKGMVTASKEFPQYGFEKHKGYGTKAHIEAIKNIDTQKCIDALLK